MEREQLTETEMGGLREERFGGTGRGVENEGEMGEWRRVVDFAVKQDQ